MEAGTSMVRESPQESTVITLPPDLLAEAQRIASEEKWTIGQTVIFLAKRGVVSQKIQKRTGKEAMRGSWQTLRTPKLVTI